MTRHDRNGSVDPRNAWATPLDAPMYPPYPLPFRDLELLTLQYRTDPDESATDAGETLTTDHLRNGLSSE